MRILIRTDASVEIGSGHVMRCLTLAEQLRDLGADVCFVCRDRPGHMIELINERGFSAAKLPTAKTSYSMQHFDAEETINAASQLLPQGIDWLIVDHYQLDITWECQLRPHINHLMVIDDLADRKHECDLLLDQNFELGERYRNLVPDKCHLLLGPHFALLRPEYSAHRKRMRSRYREIQRIMVFFGGSDQQNITGLSLQALSSDELRYLNVELVVGSNFAHREELDLQATQRTKTIIHGPRAHLADLMAQADLAIGAGGVTNWERMCLGLPSIVVTLAENQVQISQLLDREGAIRLIGCAEDVTAEDIRNALLDEIHTHRHLRRAEIAMKQCDGLGTSRVAGELLATKNQGSAKS